jgi:hypothetical protein
MTDRVTATHPDLAPLVATRPVILVFVPNTNELQRFVLAGAFAELGRDRQLLFVLPEPDAEKMRAAAAPVLTADNSITLRVPPGRFETWVDVFKTGCVHYAGLSPSFALREGLPVDPSWKDAWDMSPEARQALDAAFDAAVAAKLAGLSPLPALLELFDRYQPVCCVVPTSLLDPFCNEVAWACETEGVACFLLQSGWDNLSSKGLVYGRTPFLGGWGPQSLEHALTIQRLSPKRVAALGAPHYEFLRPAPPDDIRRLRTELGVAEGQRLLLFGGSFRQFDETSTLRKLEKAIARGGLEPVRIVYRPHPWRASRRHEDSFFDHKWEHVVFDPDMRDRYLSEQAERGFIKRHAPMFDMAYLSTLISAADAVISPMSTLLLESLLLEKPTMAIAFGDGKHRYDPSVTAQMTHFDELRGSSALVWCDDVTHLVKSCTRLLQRDWDEKRERARRKLIDRVVVREPGSYADRLASFYRGRVDGHARKWRAQRTGVKKDTISHSYGAHVIARRYCGVAGDDAIVPGYWMHGWLPSFHNVDPAVIALHKKPGQFDGYDFATQIERDKAHTPQWVSRADQVEFLQAHGYRHVHAIGLPFVYLPKRSARRVPGSLLVLPPHGHRSHGPSDPLAEAYADAIAGLRSRFEHIWVGVSDHDVANDDWVQSFTRRGLSVFTTADQGAPDTLVRLQEILSTFEYVTTNGFGSHIALAACCGARVSVWGPFAEFPVERMATTYTVKVLPHLLETACELVSERALRRHYPFLFVEPHDAMTHEAWGAEEVGAPWQASPAALRHLFGWAAVPEASEVRGEETSA